MIQIARVFGVIKALPTMATSTVIHAYLMWAGNRYRARRADRKAR